MSSVARRGLIVLLGAGASIDAGLPSVEDLTQAVYHGFTEAEQVRVLEQIALVEPAARNDYEALFQWMGLAMRHPSLRSLLGLGGQGHLIGDMTRIARRSIVRSLRVPLDDRPIAYLSGLARFRPWALDGPLEVFTLNYDICVETACRVAGLRVSTGFESGAWTPSGLRKGVDVTLYKLHGSLNWFSDTSQQNTDGMLSFLPIVEGSVDDPRMPQLILGPGSKVQADDPFFLLLNRFHEAIQRAALCVVVGYGWRDNYITARIDRAQDAGMQILNVNPMPTPLWFGEHGFGLSSDTRCTNLELGAREALVGDRGLNEIETILGTARRVG